MERQDFMGLYESYMDVYGQDEYLTEREDSPYEKASDAALDSAYGYGRATGNKHSFGRAANRSSAAAALRAIRRGERSGSGTSTEAGADVVHQGWARTAKTSPDQTPEKKAKRAGLANTPYSRLPEDEKEKDRVSFRAVQAVYNNRRNIRSSYDYDLYDLVLEYLLDEGLCESVENAEIMMAHMSEEWVDSIIDEATKTVMSVTSPTGKQRRLNTTRATGPARELTYGDRSDAFRERGAQRANREGRSFTPEAERRARQREQSIQSYNRSEEGKQPDYYHMRWGLKTGNWLQRKYGIPDSALDKQ